MFQLSCNKARKNIQRKDRNDPSRGKRFKFSRLLFHRFPCALCRTLPDTARNSFNAARNRNESASRATQTSISEYKAAPSVQLVSQRVRVQDKGKAGLNGSTHTHTRQCRQDECLIRSRSGLESTQPTTTNQCLAPLERFSERVRRLALDFPATAHTSTPGLRKHIAPSGDGKSMALRRSPAQHVPAPCCLDRGLPNDCSRGHTK